VTPIHINQHLHRVFQEDTDAANPYSSANLRKQALAALQDLKSLRQNVREQNYLTTAMHQQLPHSIQALEDVLTRAHLLPAKALQQELIDVLRAFLLAPPR
jgi:hypothetical protein